jgi:hypothetical protein
MYRMMILLFAAALLVGCGGGTGEPAGSEPEAAAQRPLIQVEAPEPLSVPALVEVASDDDWKSRTHNKEVEIIQVLNVINPVAAYIVAGFDQYGSKFSETLHEEWGDTQKQLTAATTLYDDCKDRIAAGEFDKQLFLDMEEVWQLLVKTGVAGVRTKTMIDDEVARATR